MSDNEITMIEKTTLTRVPDSERKGWVDIALIQAGIIICVPSLLYGGMLAEKMDFWPAMLAGFLGYSLSILMTTSWAFRVST